MDEIITNGKGLDTRMLKNIPSNIHVYSSVPQLEVLCIADVFVTHGGMNSISEALVHGVPMVVIPFMADQPVNARQVETLGLGKRLKHKTVNSESLKETVWSVLWDEQIEANLANAQDWIAHALGNKGGAELILEYYREWRNAHDNDTK